MSVFAGLLSPEVLARLNERDIETLRAVVDNEIMSNANIRAELQKAVGKVETHLSPKVKKP